VGMIGWCVPRIAGRFGINPAAASWFVLANPIVIIDFVGGAHNDALMMGLAMMGIWITTKWRTWWWGAVAVGMGAAIKQPAVFVAVALPFITHPWTSWRLRPLAAAAARALASLAISVAVFALLSVVTGLGFGWVNAVDVPGKVTSASPFNLLGEAVEYLLNQVGIDQGGKTAVTVMRSLGLLVCAIGIVWLALRHLGRRPLNFTGWGLLLSAFTLPALHSWYLLWGGVLFPMTRPNTRRLRIAIIISAVLLAYEAMVFAVRNGTWLVALLLIWAVWESVKAHELTQRWDAKAPQESLAGS
jgi:putative membrane protein